MRDHATRLKVLHLCTLSAARRSVERDIADLQNEVDFEIKLELRESEDGDLEEEIGTGLVDGEVADLIEDEQCQGGVAAQFGFKGGFELGGA